MTADEYMTIENTCIVILSCPMHPHYLCAKGVWGSPRKCFKFRPSGAPRRLVADHIVNTIKKGTSNV